MTKATASNVKFDEGVSTTPSVEIHISRPESEKALPLRTSSKPRKKMTKKEKAIEKRYKELLAAFS